MVRALMTGSDFSRRAFLSLIRTCRSKSPCSLIGLITPTCPGAHQTKLAVRYKGESRYWLAALILGEATLVCVFVCLFSCTAKHSGEAKRNSGVISTQRFSFLLCDDACGAMLCLPRAQFNNSVSPLSLLIQAEFQTLQSKLNCLSRVV